MCITLCITHFFSVSRFFTESLPKQLQQNLVLTFFDIIFFLCILYNFEKYVEIWRIKACNFALIFMVPFSQTLDFTVFQLSSGKLVTFYKAYDKNRQNPPRQSLLRALSLFKRTAMKHKKCGSDKAPAEKLFTF